MIQTETSTRPAIERTSVQEELGRGDGASSARPAATPSVDALVRPLEEEADAERRQRKRARRKRKARARESRVSFSLD